MAEDNKTKEYQNKIVGYTPPQPIPPIIKKSLKNGLITEGSISENERPDTTCSESINFDFDIIGSAKIRQGSTRLGNQLGASNILGMHYLVDTVSPNTNTQMIVVNGRNAYYLSGTTWIAKRTGLTSGAEANFSTYLNYVFMVNGVDATAVWDGSASAFSTAGNASGAPIGKFIENFRSRMWIMGNPSKPSRIYYSSIPSSVATPIITWNTSDTVGLWIDISPSDGDFPTALQRFYNVMLVFKTNRIYRIFDIGQTDPDPKYMVGTYSQKSVVETKVGVYFHHSSGFYQYGISGELQEISRPIWDIIKAIPSSSYSSVTGWVETTGDHICWSVGTVTIKGITYTNLVVRYCISTMTWSHRTYPTQIVASLRRNPLYNDGSKLYALTGDTQGNIIEMNTGTTDLGTSIPYSLTHGWVTGDGLLSTRKTIMVANFTHYGGAGTNVVYQNENDDPDNPNTWRKIGQLKTINTGFNSVDIKARKWRIRIYGQSAGDPFLYNGYEMLGVINEFIQFT